MTELEAPGSLADRLRESCGLHFEGSLASQWINSHHIPEFHLPIYMDNNSSQWNANQTALNDATYSGDGAAKCGAVTSCWHHNNCGPELPSTSELFCGQISFGCGEFIHEPLDEPSATAESSESTSSASDQGGDSESDEISAQYLSEPKIDPFYAGDMDGDAMMRFSTLTFGKLPLFITFSGASEIESYLLDKLNTGPTFPVSTHRSEDHSRVRRKKITVGRLLAQSRRMRGFKRSLITSPRDEPDWVDRPARPSQQSLPKKLRNIPFVAVFKLDPSH